jgi:hypothetical protein
MAFSTRPTFCASPIPKINRQHRPQRREVHEVVDHRRQHVRQPSSGDEALDGYLFFRARIHDVDAEQAEEPREEDHDQREVHEDHKGVRQPVPQPLYDVQKALEATAALLCRFGDLALPEKTCARPSSKGMLPVA